MNKIQTTRPCMKNGVYSITRNNVEVDRISSLPDEVLTHMLSFLITKEAVQTCILSKRWKNIWAAVPILNIKQKHFLINYCRKEDDDCIRNSNLERAIARDRSGFEQLGMSLARFERFMTGFLDNRAPTNLERVNCICDFQCWETNSSMRWLDRVVLLLPLQIHIFIRGSGNSLDIPDLVFSCASLQHLVMSIYPETLGETIISLVSINLPSLKFLELISVELPDDFPEKLFMGCPSLERLTLRSCTLNFSSISSEMLKELTLHKCYLYKQMQISCPALVSFFMIIDLLGNGFSLKNTTSLVNVVIKLSRLLYEPYPDEVNVPVLNLFGGLSNVTNLELCLHLPKLKGQLEKDIPNCTNFNNLKKLVMGGIWDMRYDFYLIACLLKHSPNLKELHLLLLAEHHGKEPRRDVSGDALFQYEYLETVQIGREFGLKLSKKRKKAMIKTLGTYIKKIGNIIIT